MRRIQILLLCLLLVLVVVVGALAYVLVHQANQNGGITGGSPTPAPGSTSTFTPPKNMPHVVGDQIIGPNGQPLILRGAQIETSFNYIKRWDSGERPVQAVPASVFQTMVKVWHMNVMRLPLSNWIYAKDTAEYTSQLDQIVQEANAAGLYVVLDLHDDHQAGSPYTSKAADLPKTEDIPFWKAIATHFKNNTMVMYDLYNEPKDPNWQVWLHGGGTFGGAQAVGFQDLVNAVRSVGAGQIVIVEPGSAGKGAGASATGTDVAEESGWTTIGNNTINDPDVVYSLHVYEGITATPDQLTQKWGPILGHYPIYYGEWAFLPNAGIAAHCQDLPTNPTQANQVVQNFLNYMGEHNASWTAWQFAPGFMVENYTNFQPTTLNTSWTCGNTQQKNVGMGQVIMQYLNAHPAQPG